MVETEGDNICLVGRGPTFEFLIDAIYRALYVTVISIKKLLF